MQSRRITQVGTVIPTATFLASAMAFALAEAGASGVVNGLSPAQSLEQTWLLGAGWVEALVSEGVILFLCALGGGLMIAVLEAFDLWREIRKTRAESHTRTFPVPETAAKPPRHTRRPTTPRPNGRGFLMGGAPCVDTIGSSSVCC